MKQQNIHIENGGEKKLKSFFQLRCSITGITNGLGCNKRQVQCPQKGQCKTFEASSQEMHQNTGGTEKPFLNSACNHLNTNFNTQISLQAFRLRAALLGKKFPLFLNIIVPNLKIIRIFLHLIQYLSVKYFFLHCIYFYRICPTVYMS